MNFAIVLLVLPISFVAIKICLQERRCLSVIDSLLCPCAVQQHVETNLKVTVARISILFSFFDKKPEYSCYERENQAKAAQYVHYLDMKFLDLLLVLQVILQSPTRNQKEKFSC